jgi:TatD DNase family protein
LIDSHCHLDKCPGEPGEVLGRAVEAGVERVLTVGLGPESNRRQVELAKEFTPVFAAVGHHPNDATGFGPESLETMRELATNGRGQVVAIGETGLDRYRDTAPIADQRRAFSAQIALAVELDLPLVVHLRDREGSEEATAEAFETLGREGPDLTVILHCFSMPDWVERAVERGWYCSFAGNVTYPASVGLREAAATVPDDLVLVETDAPFLTPQSRRGDRNEPALITETFQTVTSCRGVDLDALDRTVTENAGRIFGW